MKHRRSAAVFLAVLLTLMSVPFAAFAESGVVFTFSCSVPENRQPELGDTVT